MSFIAGAIIGSALVGGAASIIGSNRAAGATRDATDASVAEQRRQYDQTREDFQPWLQSGTNALNQLADPTNNFYASPDYEFRRSEGMRDIGNQYAAKGGGGNAMKALTGYNSNLASGEFNNWFNRTFAQSEAGRGATGAVGMAGQNSANNISGAYGQQGANLGNIYQNQAANLNNQVQGGISNYLYAKRTGMI